MDKIRNEESQVSVISQLVVAVVVVLIISIKLYSARRSLHNKVLSGVVAK